MDGNRSIFADAVGLVKRSTARPDEDGYANAAIG